MRFLERHTPYIQTARFGFWALPLLLAPQISWAAGTPSGTSISNSATLAYTIGAVAQTSITATTTPFLVDEKINLTVAGGITTNVATGATAQAAAYTITNNANSALDFGLAVTSAIAGDIFDPTACSVFVESNAIPNGYQVGVDTATYIDELAADATKTVYAVCNIPAALASGNTGLVGLTATARGNFNAAGYVASAAALGAAIIETAGADTVNADIVFADVAGTDDAVRDAAHSARNTYSVSIPTLTITKTASVLDPQGGSVVMPTSVITYQIDVGIAGAGTVTGLKITDPLPANTTYVANSISITCKPGIYAGGGACGIGTISTAQSAAAKTDTNLDADFADFNGTVANTITVLLGDVTAQTDFTITFKATIN